MNTSTQPEHFPRPIKSAALIILGLIVSALGVWWIARAIDLDRLVRTFQSVETRWLLAAIIAILATIFTRTWRWSMLLRPLIFTPSLVATVLLAGQMINFVLPIRLGDIVRSIWLGRAPNSSFARVFGSIVIEKAWDWLMLCAIVILCALVIPLPPWLLLPARTAGVIATMILIAFIVIATLPDVQLQRILVQVERRLAPLPARWRTFVLENGLRLAASLIALRHRKAIIGAAVWTAATWGLGGIANYSVMRAYGVDSWSVAMLLLVVLIVGVALPPSIAAIGVFEGLTILTLSAFNISIELALAIGIALHLVIFVLPLMALGLLLVWNALRTFASTPANHQSEGE